MLKKSIILTAVAGTAFFLVVSASFAKLINERNNQPVPTATQAVVVQPNDALNAGNVQEIQQLMTVMAQREADYQAALEKANQQLQAAYAAQGTQAAADATTIQQVQADATRAEETRVVGQATPGPLANGNGNRFAISEDQAKELALVMVPNGRIASTELVNFEGKVAYEVAFDTGKVYVDAQDGSILYDSVSAGQATIDQNWGANNLPGNNSGAFPPPPGEHGHHGHHDDDYDDDGDD